MDFLNKNYLQAAVSLKRLSHEIFIWTQLLRRGPDQRPNGHRSKSFDLVGGLSETPLCQQPLLHPRHSPLAPPPLPVVDYEQELTLPATDADADALDGVGTAVAVAIGSASSPTCSLNTAAAGTTVTVATLHSTPRKDGVRIKGIGYHFTKLILFR
jgi:hypothetical protein